jgi:RING finger protein 113A
MAETPPVFKKGKSKVNIRKRPVESEAVEDVKEDEDTVVIRPDKKGPPAHALIQSVQTKRKKVSLLEEHAFSASGTASSLLPTDMGATAIVEIDTEKDKDSIAVLKKTLELQKELEGKADDNIYRGQAGYAQYLQKQDTSAGGAATSKSRYGGSCASHFARRFSTSPLFIRLELVLCAHPATFA